MPGTRADLVSRSTNATDANAQAFFNNTFDTIVNLEIPHADMDLGSEEWLPRVAQDARPDYGWAWELNEVLQAASSAWQRLPTIESEALLPSRWNSLNAFLVDTAKDKFDFATKPLGVGGAQGGRRHRGGKERTRALSQEAAGRQELA